MLIKILPNNEVKLINLNYNETQENKFVELNQNAGFKKIDSLPFSEYGFYKWCEIENKVIEDIEANSRYKLSLEVELKKQFLRDTDFKFLGDYDKEDVELAEIRLERSIARQFIRENEVL
jgi:hypothetical protein